MVGSSYDALPTGELLRSAACVEPERLPLPAEGPAALSAVLPAGGDERPPERLSKSRTESQPLSRFQQFYTTRDPRLRSELVLEHLALAHSIARRFTWPGLTADDFLQIARVGLIHAVDRFDPRRGVTFATFATHTIAGEVKRYLRDHGWPVKVPRQLREVYQQLRRADDVLTRRLQRSPTVAELAHHLGVEEETILEAQALSRAAASVSIDTPVTWEETGSYLRLCDHVAVSDTDLSEVETRLWVRAGVDALEMLHRKIVHLRYFQGLTQAEVAQRLRLSQMHVSRLERRALDHLRRLLAER